MQRHSTPMWAPPPCFIFDFYCVLCRNVPLEDIGGWREGAVGGCRGAAADTLLGLNRRRSSLPFYVYSWGWWQVKTASVQKQLLRRNSGFFLLSCQTLCSFILFFFLQSNKFLRFFTGTTWFQLHYFLPNIVNRLRCVFTLFSRHFPYGQMEKGLWTSGSFCKDHLLQFMSACIDILNNAVLLALWGRLWETFYTP